MNRKHRLIWIAPLAVLGMALFAFVGGEVVKLLWNWLLPPLFGWKMIEFWQAIGLLVLCRILFGGLGWRGAGYGRGRLRRRMEEHCAEMSPEERERFRQRMRERMGFDPMPPTAGETKTS
jgi:hypothetical protein